MLKLVEIQRSIRLSLGDEFKAYVITSSGHYLYLCDVILCWETPALTRAGSMSRYFFVDPVRHRKYHIYAHRFQELFQEGKITSLFRTESPIRSVMDYCCQWENNLRYIVL